MKKFILIGRTARAGKGGVAVSFYENRDFDKVEILKETFEDLSIRKIEDIKANDEFEIDSEFRVLYINGGKKQKLRPGDILGALTAGLGLDKNDIGKITSYDFCTYVAVKKEVLTKAYKGLRENRIKKKFFRVFKK